MARNMARSRAAGPQHGPQHGPGTIGPAIVWPQHGRSAAAAQQGRAAWAAAWAIDWTIARQLHNKIFYEGGRGAKILAGRTHCLGARANKIVF